jgi:hypothetical protein
MNSSLPRSSALHLQSAFEQRLAWSLLGLIVSNIHPDSTRVTEDLLPECAVKVHLGILDRVESLSQYLNDAGAKHLNFNQIVQVASEQAIAFALEMGFDSIPTERGSVSDILRGVTASLNFDGEDSPTFLVEIPLSECEKISNGLRAFFLGYELERVIQGCEE